MKVKVINGKNAGNKYKVKVENKEHGIFGLEDLLGNTVFEFKRDCVEIKEEQSMKVFCIKSGVGVEKGKWYEVLQQTPNYYYLQGGDMRTGVIKSNFITQFDLNLSDIEIKYVEQDTQYTKELLNSIYSYIDTDSAMEDYERNTQLVKANENFRVSTIKPELYNKLIKTKDLEWKEKVLLLAILNEEENRWK